MTGCKRDGVDVYGSSSSPEHLDGPGTNASDEGLTAPPEKVANGQEANAGKGPNGSGVSSGEEGQISGSEVFNAGADDNRQ